MKRLALYLLVSPVCLFLFLNCANEIWLSLAPSRIYEKDFLSPYLMARALLDGADPHAPLPDLARTYLGIPDYSYFSHPSPHPPLMALLFLPLGFLSYKAAFFLWLAVEAGCLVAFLLLLRNWFGKELSAPRAALALTYIVSWSPFQVEMRWGQFNLLLLLLLTGALILMRGGRDRGGGAVLGLALAMKMMGWPILIYLALRRRWQSVTVAIAVVAASNMIAVALLGLGWAETYYRKIGPSVAALCQSDKSNYSTWTFGRRLFLGANLYGGAHAAPIYESQTLARVAWLGIPALVLLIGLVIALRMKDRALAFGLLAVVSLLISPVLWSHYFLLILLPLTLWLRKMRESGWPRRTLVYAAPVLIGLLAGPDLWNRAAGSFAVDGAAPPWAGLIVFISFVALLGLVWLLWRADRGVTDTATQEPHSAAIAQPGLFSREIKLSQFDREALG